MTIAHDINVKKHLPFFAIAKWIKLEYFFLWSIFKPSLKFVSNARGYFSGAL
jgi:hypothetical protein